MSHFPNIFSRLTCHLLPIVATVPRGDICAGAGGAGAQKAAASPLQGPVISAPAAASEDQAQVLAGLFPQPWAAPRVLAAAEHMSLFIVTIRCSIKLHLETRVLRYNYEEFQEGTGVH